MRKLLNILYVTQPEAYISKDGECVVISINQKEVFRVPAINIEGIVTFGYMGCSPGAMRLCMEKNINIVFLSPQGRFIARVQGPQRGNIYLRKAQYSFCDDKSKRLALSRLLIAAKIRNSRMNILRRIRDYGKDDQLDILCHSLREFQSRAIVSESEDGLRGLEGYAARIYFEQFNKLLRVEGDFFSFKERSRRPPKDAVNALLSFAYTILTNEIVASLESVGLDAYCGVFHTLRSGRPALALDILEEFRSYMCDRFVISLINRHQIQRKHFIAEDSKSVLLTDEGRRIFISNWQHRKKEQIIHPRLEEKVEIGLLPYIQAQIMARYIRGQMDEYTPFVVR